MLINELFLYDDRYPLNNGLFIKHPLVQEVIDFDKLPIYKSKVDDRCIKIFLDGVAGEEFELYQLNGSKYQILINIFLIYPVDLIVELYDLGYPDFEVFSQYDIFLMLYSSNEPLYMELMKFFLGDVELRPAENTSTGERVLYDERKDIVFDITSFMIMSNFIKAIHHIPEDRSKTAKKSKSLKRVLIESERANKAIRAQLNERNKLSGKSDQYLRRLITKITVASQFRKHELMEMKLYEFYETVNEVIGYNYWKYKMTGVYTGNIDTKKMNKKELDWFFN